MLSVHLCDVFGGILAGFGHRYASDGELRPQRWIQFTRELHTNLKNVSKCSIFKINREKDDYTRLGKGKLCNQLNDSMNFSAELSMLGGDR